MPDRLLRDELLESERWLDLPSDTDRLAFIPLLLNVDDFGNLEAGLRRLFRLFHKCTQVKTEEHTAVVLAHLHEADLARPYQVAAREFLHLPRFRPHRQYLTRKVPASPWDYERELGKDRRVISRGLAKEHELGENIATTSHQRSNDVAEGVGVGVGVGVVDVELPETSLPPGKGKGAGKGNPKRATRLADDWKIPEDWIAVGLAVHPDWSRAGIIRESLTFHDHWCAKAPGKDATRVNWLLTWRTWIRRSAVEPVR
jgi:hypothetical protein